MMTEIDCKWNLTFQGLNIKPAKLFKENKLHFTFSSAIKFAARVVWEDVAHDLQTTKYHLQLLIINDNKFQPKNLFLQSRLDTKKKMFVCVENHNCIHFNPFIIHISYSTYLVVLMTRLVYPSSFFALKKRLTISASF